MTGRGDQVLLFVPRNTLPKPDYGAKMINSSSQGSAVLYSSYFSQPFFREGGNPDGTVKKDYDLLIYIRVDSFIGVIRVPEIQ